MPKENYAWYYLGNGIETFGINGKPSKYEMKLPGKDEILARVDAVALCASDIKMIRMGNDYPLFKNRDFHKDPAILLQELSLTNEEVGENLKDRWNLKDELHLLLWIVGLNRHPDTVYKLAESLHRLQ